MAEKDPTKRPKPKNPKTSYAYPWLHPDIVKAVSDVLQPRWIDSKNRNDVFNKEKSTSVIGKFTCSNSGCSNKGWSSGTVSILIRGYPNDGYNAVVFNQRCKFCKQLGDLKMDNSSYVERVAYRLKKWAGIPMEQLPYVAKESPPHERDFCEGCKRGYCLEGRKRSGRD